MGAEAVGPKRILVVDDEPGVRRLLNDLFAGEGYVVSEPGDGVAALDRVRAFRPDVVVLDLMMPVMDGWTFAAECRRINTDRDVPIIAISAMFELQGAAGALRALGVRACLSKPFDVDDILSLVAAVV